MKDEKIIMKNEKCMIDSGEWLEQYLAGKAPMHADRLEMPSDEELDAAEAEFDAAVSTRKQPARRIPLWTWAAAVAAVVVAVVMAWLPSSSPQGGRTSVPQKGNSDKALMAAVAKEETKENMKEEAKPQIGKMQEGSQTSKASKPAKAATAAKSPAPSALPAEPEVMEPTDLNPVTVISYAPQDTKLVAEAAPPADEESSPIPPDKQALADMYLAEVALQVVYQRQAQAEALRAYAASITGEETPKAIIAF